MRREDLKQEYDIVIVGGGMVGATLACALATRAVTKTLSVLIVDSQPPAGQSAKTGEAATTHESFDSRSTALSASSRLILERFGLWSQLGVGACPINKIHVSDQGRFGAYGGGCLSLQRRCAGGLDDLCRAVRHAHSGG